MEDVDQSIPGSLGGCSVVVTSGRMVMADLSSHPI